MKKLETETSAPNSPKGRETGLVVRLFSTPPHIFGISPQLDGERSPNGRQGAGHHPESFDEFDLRPPLEEEALNLSRMLKNLPLLDKFPGFPVASTGNETPDLLPHHHSNHHHGMAALSAREMTHQPQLQAFSFDSRPPSPPPPGIAAGTRMLPADDDQERRWGSSSPGVRSNGGFHAPGTERNDGHTMRPRSPEANSNKNTPKSNRKMYGPSHSRSSTPNTSAGSASELLFPTSDLRSPPSPEPLGSARPGSPLKWRTRPTSEEAAQSNNSRGIGGRASAAARDMPVQGLLGGPGGASRKQQQQPQQSGATMFPSLTAAPAAASSDYYSNGKISTSSPFQDIRRNLLDVVGRGGSGSGHGNVNGNGESSSYSPYERRGGSSSSSSSSAGSSVAKRTNAFKASLEDGDTRGGTDYYPHSIGTASPAAGSPPIPAVAAGSTASTTPVRDFPRPDLRVTPPRDLQASRSLNQGAARYNGGGNVGANGIVNGTQNSNGSENQNGNDALLSPSRFRSSPVSVVNPFQVLFRETIPAHRSSKKSSGKSSSVASSSRDVSPPYTSPPSPAKSSKSSKSSKLSGDSTSGTGTGTRPPLEPSFRLFPEAAATTSSSSKPETDYQAEDHQQRLQVGMADLSTNPEEEQEEEEDDDQLQRHRSWEALPRPFPSPSTAAPRAGDDFGYQGSRSPPLPYPRHSSEVEAEEDSFMQSPAESHDDEFELGQPKGDFFTDSRSPPSYFGSRTPLAIAKSEPVGRWPTADTSPNDDAMMHSGHRPRSMSLPGTQMLANAHSLPPTPSDVVSQGRNGQQRRKGECYLCHKGTRMTDKEPCLACESKYCCNCVLTAMESMPEGRKCRTCIGKPVQEAKRACIGRPSRLLSRLLSPQEVQQIMKAERECAANQLRPEQLCVNGKQLAPEELSILLKCPNPPQKLKPGRYWYDSQSGLWGKEGERPDKLISPDMKLGGMLQENASNGTTQVYMNNRELGKLEVKMLKLAGVHCPPPTHLWVEPDGSYQEVGMKNFKGNIWNKTSIRLLYPFFSLPTPGASARYSPRGESPKDVPDVYNDYAIQNKLHKILVLGHEGSGRSTLFKQTKFIFRDGFKPEERLEIKSMIQQHIYRYMGILLEGRERFEEEAEELEQNRRCCGGGEYAGETSISGFNVYALDSRLKEQARHITDLLAEDSFDEQRTSSNSSQLGLSLDELWNSPAIQDVYRRKDELNNLPVAAGYFLKQAREITSVDYLPSDDDILRAEGLAQGSGLAEMEFFLDDRLPHQDHDSSPSRFQLIKVGGNGLAEGCKWLDMFEDVHAVVFCVAISEYDQVLTDRDGVTRSKLRQKELFDSVLKHPILGEKPMVLLLNKYDLFEEKICTGVPLTTCEWFTDFRPVGASQLPASIQAQQGYTYVVHKYKELFQASGHKLFTFKLNAVERDQVVEAFHYVREILNWKDNSWDLFPEESSAYSTDLSSYSHHHLHAPPRHDGGFLIDR